jgi:hypothetical protein
MAVLWAHIVDGVLVSVGDLPAAARRLDTGELVYDLGGEGAKWLRATGYFDADTVDPAILTADQDKIETLESDLAAARDARDDRSAFVDKVHALTSLARDANWDWIDGYCHGTVADIQFVQEQSPTAGADWGALSTFDKAERLRLGVSLALVENIRISQAIDLVLDKLAELIAHDSTLTPPPDR